MSHISEKRWSEIRDQLSSMSNDMFELLSRIRGFSIQMGIIASRAGAGTDEDIAAQFFMEEIEARGDTMPSALEVQMVADAREVSLALNDLWKAANNEAIATENRMNVLKRIS